MQGTGTFDFGGWTKRTNGLNDIVPSRWIEGFEIGLGLAHLGMHLLSSDHEVVGVRCSSLRRISCPVATHHVAQLGLDLVLLPSRDKLRLGSRHRSIGDLRL